jgi:hypothetical protein
MSKASTTVRIYYVLPCCLLLLNLVNAIVGYQAERIGEPWLRTVVVIALVLFGSSLITFLVAPGLESFVRWIHRTTKAQAGGWGEAGVLIGLGAVVFWLYFLMSNQGVAAIVPAIWRHP